MAFVIFWCFLRTLQKGLVRHFEKPPHVVDFFATAVVLVLGNPPRAISSNRLGIDKVKSNSGGPKEAIWSSWLMANFWSGNTEMLDKYKHAWNLKKPVTCFSGICLHMELMSTIFLLVSLQSKEHDTPNHAKETHAHVSLRAADVGEGISLRHWTKISPP